MYAAIAARVGVPVTDDRTLLDAFGRAFQDTWQVRDWLKENGIPYTEKR
ncbi:MAG: hypothetical protein WDO73_34685 [Ignavibacteriota bacterium]